MIPIPTINWEDSTSHNFLHYLPLCLFCFVCNPESIVLTKTEPQLTQLTTNVFTMYSPRYSSTGSYRTKVTLTSDCRPEFYGVTVQSDLVQSTQELAKIKVTEFLVTLPGRSWLGKLIADAVLDETHSPDSLVAFANRCWNSLISFEEQERNLRYISLLPSGCHEDVLRFIKVMDSCWQKCVALVQYSAESLVFTNPAYLRMSTFTLERFMRIVLLKSMMMKHSRHKWVRIINLMDYTVQGSKHLG